MVKRVELPDGTVAEFPDNTPNEKIEEVVRRQVRGGGTNQPLRSPDVRGPGDTTFTEYLTTLGQSAATITSGAVTTVAGGINALGIGAYEYLTGGEDPLAASVAAIENAQEMTFEPTDPQTKQIFGLISQPQEQLDEFAKNQGAAVADATGSPALGAAQYTAINFLPDLVAGGVSRAGRVATSRAGQKAAGRQVERDLKSQGISPGASRETQANQIVARGRDLVGDQQRAGSLEDIQESVISLKKQMKDAEDAAWDELRETEAYVPVDRIKPLAGMVRDVFEQRQFVIKKGQDSPINDRLDELEKLERIPAGSQMKLNALVNFRKRLNANQPPKDTPAFAANNAIKGVLDRFMMNDFNTSMISGDPTAVKKWNKANAASRKLNDMFRSKTGRRKILKQLAEQDVTPEQMRQWLFNSSATVGAKQAGLYLKSIKEVVGEGSPQFNALRKDALLDILDPVIGRDPNVSQFVKNYDKLIKNNRSMAEELFGKSTLKELETFAEAADKVVRVGEQDLGKFNITKNAARILFGHEIAQGAVRVGLAERGFIALRNISGKSKKRKFLGQMLGYDPFKRVMPSSPLFVEGAATAAEQQQENNGEGSN